jgi:hypothetical protein
MNLSEMWCGPNVCLDEGPSNPARKPEKKRATMIFATLVRSIRLQTNAWDK